MRPRRATARSLRRWQQGPLAKGLAYGERLEQFETGSGIPVERLYTPLELEDDDPAADQGFPGESRSPAASSRRCTAAGCGASASTPGTAPRPTPTPASASSSPTASRG